MINEYDDLTQTRVSDIWQ